MMKKWSIAVLSLLASSVGVVSAFEPVSLGKISALRQQVQQEHRAPLLVPQQMVSGGAERSMNNEYYDGECSFGQP